MSRKIYAALIHYPVIDKKGMLVSTSVTNLDIHDISRSATTYDLAGYFLVTPIEAQHWLVSRILSHWETGWGSTYNTNRKDALNLTKCTADIGSMSAEIEAACGEPPIYIATSARSYPNSISYEAARHMLDQPGRPVVLMFGTGWGMHPELLMEADFILEPIHGRGAFNHLSVRAAAAIIFDRLLGR